MAQTTSIGASETVNSSSIAAGNSVNFTGDGILAVDAANNVGAISVVNNNSGTINFSSANALTVGGNIGDSVNLLKSVIFNANGTLDLSGNLYATALTTATNEQGNFTISGASSQIISSSIGSFLLRLNAVNINQNSGATFSQAVYAKDFSTINNGSNLTITNNASLNFTNSTISTNAAFSGTGTAGFGSLTVSNNKTLTLNSNASASSVNLSNAASVIEIASDKNLTVSRNITGLGTIQGVSDKVGNLVFSGSSAQSVESSVKIGTASKYLGNLNVSNSAGAITFNNDVYANRIVFSQSSGSSSISIVSGKIINIAGDITASSGGSSSKITGAGTLNLSGSAAQNISAGLGDSTSSRLSGLQISNGSSITFSGNAYLTNFAVDASGATIAANGVFNASNTQINQSATISGSGNINLGALTLASEKILTVNAALSASSLSSLDSQSTIDIASGKSISLSGDITGPGVMKGEGSLIFSGTGAQNIAANYQLGSGASNRLGNLVTQNSNSITLTNDAYVKTVNFYQSSGSAAFSITSGKNLNVTGNISTGSGALNSAITGDGTLTLSGTSVQTISAALGSGSTNRLGSLVVNNAPGVIISANNNYLTSLTLTTSNLEISGNATLDVANAVNLSSKTLNIGYKSDANPFGKIVSGGDITINDSTKINFLYNSSAVSPKTNVDYIIASSATAIIGNVSNIAVTDDSLLFNNTLSTSNGGKDIVTNIVIDDSTFNSQILGEDIYKMLGNALNTDLASGLLGVSGNDELKALTDNLTPMNNSAHLNSIISSNRQFMKITGFDEDRSLRKINEDSAVWGKAYGTYLKQKSRQKTFGYKENSAGLAFGLETEGAENIKLGLGVGYNRSTIKGDSFYKNQIDLENYQLAIFNKNGNQLSGFYNHNSALFSYFRSNTERRIVAGSFNKNSKATFDNNGQAARVALGYNFQSGGNWFVDPNIAVEYFRIAGNQYRENGAGNVGLAVKNKSLNGYLFDVGINFGGRTEYFYESDPQPYFLIPKLSLGWMRTAKDYQQESSVSFIEQNDWVRNNSIALQRSVFRIGGSLKIDDDVYDSLSLECESQIGQRMVAVNYMAKYSHRF